MMAEVANGNDTRWICWKCGDLDYLSDDGLCRVCVPPERTIEWWRWCSRAVHGESDKETRKWQVS